VIQALVCTQPGELRIEQREAPKPGPGEVLVKVRRVGVCGTDYHIFEGNQPFLKYPRVMGHELSVEVVEAPASSGLTKGQVVVVNPYLSCGTCISCRKGKPNCCTRIAVLGVHRDGGMTELLSLPVQNIVKADGLSVDECAMVEFLAIGAHAVRRSRMTAQDRALVVGAGPIGLGAALFASLTGAKVSLLDQDTGRLDAAKQLFDVAHTLIAGDNLDDEIKRVTDGDGFDVVFDATGNRKAMERGFDFVAAGGSYVLVSIVQGDITFTDQDFHRREMSLYGSRNATSEDFERVISAIRDGKVPSNKWITHRTTLEGAVKDVPVWTHSKAGLIKAVIEVAP
jgi:2-desacetyl-2-hydroxyethyl bacteriochlorophyllide A dehydrogenase